MEPDAPHTSVEQEATKSSKFNIIIIVLIVISIGFVGFLVYKSNAESKTTNTSATSETIAEPVSNTDPTTVETSPTTSADEKKYSITQVAEKNSKSSCWTIIDGNVYDITAYVPNHPGGESEILKICGKDGTVLFAKPMEHKEGGASDMLAGFKVGKLAKSK